MLAAGAVNNSWNYTYNRNGYYQFDNNTWTNVNQYSFSALDTALDILSIAADPRNEDLYLGSYGGGLVKKSGNNFTVYKKNSAISPAIGDPGSYRIGGLAFDQGNNLWISNYGAAFNLVVKKADNSWKNFLIPFTLGENAVSRITIDEQGHPWIISPKGNGLIYFDYGKTIEDISDDRWRFFRAGAANGNLPDNEVFCTVKDKDGLIWIGTARGLAFIPCAGEALSTNCRAIQPIVERGIYSGPLFANEEVHALAVDGANRKWVGTNNGLWLISKDGSEVISFFNTGNSPLLSNAILGLAIDPKTGEVFIETAQGICSFRGMATEAAENSGKITVFPNPVPPAYAGSIAIKGLPENATVKITELGGRLVYETRALGGQAVWNGRDYRGRQVSSGAYLVLVIEKDGREKLATKIFIVK